MMDCKKLKHFLNENDVFCRENGIELVLVTPGYAEGILTVTPRVLNGRGVVQGGAIMTLADFTFAGAANAEGHSIVSLECHTNFIRPGTGKFLRAAAKKIHHGKATAVYSVEVSDEKGQIVAAVTVTGYVIDNKPVI